MNEKNIKFEDHFQFLMDHNKEFTACCTQIDKEDKPPIKRAYSRIQSAKSGVSNPGRQS